MFGFSVMAGKYFRVTPDTFILETLIARCLNIRRLSAVNDDMETTQATIEKLSADDALANRIRQIQREFGGLREFFDRLHSDSNKQTSLCDLDEVKSALSERARLRDKESANQRS